MFICHSFILFDGISVQIFWPLTKIDLFLYYRHLHVIYIFWMQVCYLINFANIVSLSEDHLISFSEQYPAKRKQNFNCDEVLLINLFFCRLCLVYYI